MDYLFNVALSMSGYAMAAVAIVLIVRFIKPILRIVVGDDGLTNNLEQITRIRKGGYLLAVIVLVFGAFISFTGPQRTYTNTTYDVYKDAAIVKQRNEQHRELSEDKTVKNIIRPPTQTRKELKQDFDNLSDWRTGSKTGN